jgi:hypothetical protein
MPSFPVGFVDWLVLEVGEGIGGRGEINTKEDYFGLGASLLGLHSSGVSIFSSCGPSSSLFLSKEVQTILRDYCSEPISSTIVGDFTIAQYPPSSILVENPYPSEEGGLGVDVSSPGLKKFLSRILEETISLNSPATSISLLSSCQIREANSPVRKNPKQVRKKSTPVSLAVAKAVTMENIYIYSERALVGHARGRHLSLGSLSKSDLSHWG